MNDKGQGELWKNEVKGIRLKAGRIIVFRTGASGAMIARHKRVSYQQIAIAPGGPTALWAPLHY